ncbi:MAG: hypothetical protein ACJ788_16830 [Ktedonobacteraceae bacterium]|jgi:hypothetical protein
MRFVFEYRLPTGTQAFMIFSAENEEKGQEYVRNLRENYHYQEVSDLHHITTIDDLYRLYSPKRTELKEESYGYVLSSDRISLRSHQTTPAKI